MLIEQLIYYTAIQFESINILKINTYLIHIIKQELIIGPILFFIIIT